MWGNSMIFVMFIIRLNLVTGRWGVAFKAAIVQIIIAFSFILSHGEDDIEIHISYK